MKEILGSVTGFVVSCLVLAMTTVQSANAESRVDRQIETLQLECSEKSVYRVALLKAVYDQPILNRVRIFEQDHIVASFRVDRYYTVPQSLPQHFSSEDQQMDATVRIPEQYTVIFASRQSESVAHYSQIEVYCDIERNLIEGAKIIGQWKLD